MGSTHHQREYQAMQQGIDWRQPGAMVRASFPIEKNGRQVWGTRRCELVSMPDGWRHDELARFVVRYKGEEYRVHFSSVFPLYQNEATA